MSRTLHIALSEEKLSALCAGLGLGISVLEPLTSGGTRIVLNNSGDAAILERRLKTSLIEGPIIRDPRFVSRQAIPYR